MNNKTITTPPAQPAPVQEPVAYVVTTEVHGQMCSFIHRIDLTKLLPDGAKLYTTPPAQEFVCSTGLCHYKATSDARLMEMPQQEPVAWINAEKRTFEWNGPVLWNTPTVAVMDKIPLYTTPPAQPAPVPLTDESVVSAAARVLSDRVAASCNVDCEDMWMLHGNDSIEDARAMLEAAEAKLREKNT